MGRAHKSRHEVPNEFHIEKLQLDIDTKHLKINIQRLLSEYQGPKDFGTLEFAFFLEVDSNRDRNLIVILSSSKPRHPSFRRLKEWFLSKRIKKLVKNTFDRYYNLHTIKVSDSKQMNNEWAFKFFEKTIIHSANKLLNKDRQMIRNCRQLNHRFENIAPKFKSMFQDIIKGTYSPRKKYRDSDEIYNLEMHLQQYAEQLFEFRSQDFIAQPRETVIRCIKTASKLFGVNPLCAEKNRFYLTAKLVHGTPSSTFYELLGREQIPVQFAFTQTDLRAIPMLQLFNMHSRK